MKLSVISFIYFGNEFPQFYVMEIMRKCSSYMPSIYKKWKKHIKIYSKFVNPQSIKYNKANKAIEYQLRKIEIDPKI